MRAALRSALLRSLLGLLLLSASGGCRSVESDRPLNVVLISIDTLAAGHLGFYGYARDTSPNLDRYARDAIVFDEAYSPAPQTAESHMSIFTGLAPSVHGVANKPPRGDLSVLDEKIPTLPEILQQNGYTTIAFHGDGNLAAKYGFDRGFDEYLFTEQQADAESWLAANAQRGPFFLFYHTYHVHDPYLPKPPYDSRFGEPYMGPIIHDADRLAEIANSDPSDYDPMAIAFWSRVNKRNPRAIERLIDLYDGQIAEMDAELAGLLDAIDRYAPRSIVIILSDHGEEFREHGGLRHKQLYNEILHVPLLIRHPDRSGGARIVGPVSLLDLAPTLLEMLSLTSPAQFQGHSLVDRMDGADRDALGPPVFSEFPAKRAWALIRAGRKVIVTRDGIEAYDLARDPREHRNLAQPGAPDAQKAGVEELRRELARVVKENAAKRSALDVRGTTAKPDERTMKRLRALGYAE